MESDVLHMGTRLSLAADEENGILIPISDWKAEVHAFQLSLVGLILAQSHEKMFVAPWRCVRGGLIGTFLFSAPLWRVTTLWICVWTGVLSLFISIICGMVNGPWVFCTILLKAWGNGWMPRPVRVYSHGPIQFGFG
ncbi:hypothetical protein Salat_1492700 [Sesamum alatum]|uniref:Uncharacterized protein n=1 Tax=Sesamum alatum TaxID=300844 RepID=A0AAE1YBS8_9LAMI|nr:hypothetical protein Salat_1492700 [Sesamum alatum]